MTKIIYFVSLNEVRNYIKKICEKYGKRYGNIKIKRTGDGVITIIKRCKPNWYKNCAYKRKSIRNNNNTNARIVYLTLDDNTTYVEANGYISNDVLHTMDHLDKLPINKFKYNEDDVYDFKEQVTTFYQNTMLDDVLDEFNGPLKNVDNLKLIKPPKMLFNDLIQCYDECITHSSLPPFDQTLDVEQRKPTKNTSSDKNTKVQVSSEGAYNKRVCNDGKLKLLDKGLIHISASDRIEVADIFDENENKLYHIKKNGDLRVLSCQVVCGYAVLTNESDKSNEFIKKYNIDIDKISYVFGIIMKTKNITMQNRLSIGMAIAILKHNNIESFIEKIDVIQS